MPNTNTLPNHVADFLGAVAPHALERLETAIAMQPTLQQRQAASFDHDQEALAAIKEAEGDLQRVYEAARAAGEQPNPTEVERAQRRIQARKDAREAAKATLKRATKVSAGTDEAVDRTIQMASQLTQSNSKIELAHVALKGDPERALEVEQELQARLAEAHAETDNAALPKEHILAAGLAELHSLAERGRVKVGSRGNLIWPTVPLPVMPLIGSEVVKVTDAEATIAALLTPQLEQEIKAVVEARYVDIADADTLSDVERRARKAEIAEARFASELREAAAVFALWEAGRLDVGLRANVNPLAVLGIHSWRAGEKRKAHLLVTPM